MTDKPVEVSVMCRPPDDSVLLCGDEITAETLKRAEETPILTFSLPSVDLSETEDALEVRVREEVDKRTDSLEKEGKATQGSEYYYRYLYVPPKTLKIGILAGDSGCQS